jgi:hypothetical protein
MANPCVESQIVYLLTRENGLVWRSYNVI